LTSARRAFARWTADTVVEQIHDLVRDPCCGLAQNASSARWRTTRSRRPIIVTRQGENQYARGRIL